METCLICHFDGQPDHKASRKWIIWGTFGSEKGENNNRNSRYKLLAPNTIRVGDYPVCETHYKQIKSDTKKIKTKLLDMGSGSGEAYTSQHEVANNPNFY